MIWGWVFISSDRWSQVSDGFGDRRGLVQLLDDLQHAVAAHDGIVHDEAQRGGVFQDHGLGHESLDAGAMFGEQRQAALLLVGVAEDADEDDGGLQVAGAVHVVDGDQAGLAHVEFAADGLADRALEQFAHSFVAEVGHGLGD